ATGQLRQVSPPNLHIYDYDWSPDDKTLVTTAAPGPGDNNWWIAQIYKIDIAKGDATSIYKPSLQVAVPRWSPDGKSVAFIEGLMSDEGFHGGDLFTIAADGGGLTNRTPGRKTSVSSLFWLAPERILITEYVGGGGAVSELSVADNSVRTIWKGPESFHAFGNFPDFALAKDGKFAAVVRSSYEAPPEVWAGPIGGWRQLTKNNAQISSTWGKAESVEWTNEGFWAWRSARYHGWNRCCDKKISHRSKSPRRDRMELRRFHDHVDGHPNKSVPWRSRRRRHRQLAKLLRPELDRSMDDPVLRRVGLRRSSRLRKKFADSFHQEREDSNAGDCR